MVMPVKFVGVCVVQYSASHATFFVGSSVPHARIVLFTVMVYFAVESVQPDNPMITIRLSKVKTIFRAFIIFYGFQ